MENIIMLSSMTEALKAKNILQKYRIMSKVHRFTDSDKKRGCSFGLVVPKYYERAMELILRYNIHPIGDNI